MESLKNDKKTSEDYLDSETKKFKEGNPGGPGRPKGSNDFKTDFNAAVKKLAEKRGITLGEAREMLLQKGFLEAKGGDFKFWEYIHSQIYGKPRIPLEHEIGEDLKEVIERINKILP